MKLTSSFSEKHAQGGVSLQQTINEIATYRETYDALIQDPDIFLWFYF